MNEKEKSNNMDLRAGKSLSHVAPFETDGNLC